MRITEATVESHTVIRGGYRLLNLHAPVFSGLVQPGQFLHLRVPHMEQAVLRRPFSIFKADGPSVSILYKAVGSGTSTMSFLQAGETVSIIGPLGRPFPEPQAGRTPVLVLGGYGMAALYLAARRARKNPGVAFFGGRTSDDILCVDEFSALGWDTRVATQDGSIGFHGLVTESLDEWLSAATAEGIVPEFFACGPGGMLKAVADRALARGWDAWLSLDEKMGCGVGACLTCVIKVKTEDGGWTWSRSCREGPVYNAREVLWEGATS